MPSGRTNFALFGAFGSGKSLVADYMVREYGYTRISFATSVREACVAMLNGAGIRKEPFTIEEINANKPTFRTLLQWVGTDLVRDYTAQPDFWVDRLLGQTNSGGPYVIDDLRFPNEFNAVRSRGWAPVHVKASPEQRLVWYAHHTQLPVTEAKEAFDKTATHPSEEYLTSFKTQWTLHNATSVRELEKQVDEMMHTFDYWNGVSVV